MPPSSQKERQAVAVLGSTGSIGTQTLDVIRLFPERFDVQALTAGGNADLLAEQARAFQPDCVVIGDEDQRKPLRDALSGTGIRVLCGEDGLREAAALEAVDTVVAAIMGYAGLTPVVEAVRVGKTVALANKETLVVAGALIQRLAREHGATLLPVDSEHSALFQCLVGEDPGTIEELILTASGGPFRERDAGSFESITKEEALDHPNWDMGAKITIDSATMMNKGLEVIEARWLFGVPAENIRVVVHPQSIVHSMVAFRDGSVKAQLGVPDMKGPIQYALTHPERWDAPHERLDFDALRRLDFEPPDQDKFPCLALAYDALERGGTAPAALNAANEAAVQLFLDERISFTDIPRCIEHALAAVDDADRADAPNLDALRAADRAARRRVQELTGATAD